jgi:uncharacterized paraquat-inducible protein A
MNLTDAAGVTLYAVILLASLLIPIVLVVWLLVTVSAIRRSQEDIARILRMVVEELAARRLRKPDEPST